MFWGPCPFLSLSFSNFSSCCFSSSSVYFPISTGPEKSCFSSSSINYLRSSSSFFFLSSSNTDSSYFTYYVFLMTWGGPPPPAIWEIAFALYFSNCSSCSFSIYLLYYFSSLILRCLASFLESMCFLLASNTFYEMIFCSKTMLLISTSTIPNAVLSGRKSKYLNRLWAEFYPEEISRTSYSISSILASIYRG